MICEKCNRPMKPGTVSFRSGGRSVLHAPIAEFYVEKVRIDSRGLTQTSGWYCGECGTFTAVFDTRRQNARMPLFEEGEDSNFDENIDDLPKTICPECGAEIDIDYPKCPQCGCIFEEK